MNVERAQPDRHGGHRRSGAGTGADDHTVDLLDLGRMLWQRRWLIGTIVVLATAATVAGVLLTTPTYRATAHVMLELRQERVVNFDSVLSGLSGLNPESALIDSEVEVVRSRPVAEHVIRTLNLLDNPHFNPAADPTPPPVWKREAGRWLALAGELLPGTAGDWLRRRGNRLAGIIDNSGTPAERARRTLAQVMERYYTALNVQPVGKSYVIEIAFEWRDPVLAARIADEIAQQYVAKQLEAKSEATIQANRWLSKRLTELREQVMESERAVVAYRQQHQIADVDDIEVTAQQLAELNAKMALARADRAAAEARLNQVLAVADQDGTSTIPDVLASPLVHSLREEEAALQRELLQLRRQYVDKHPRIEDAKAQVAELRQAIDEEIKRYVRSLEGEAQVARSREQTLAKDIEQLKAAVNAVGGEQVELHDLEQQVEVNRALYETFLTRFNETSEQQEIQRPDARVISAASVPEYPVRPRKTLIVALSSVASFGFAVFIVLLLERADRGFRNGAEAEQHTGLPALGLVTLERGRWRGAASPADLVKDRPMSAFAESAHTLLANLLLANGERPPRVVLITSAVPEEGKTITAIALARAAALSGRRTMLIDADMRRPTVYRIVGDPVAGPRPAGLSEVLKGERRLDEVVVRDRQGTGLYVLPAGKATGSRPFELQSSARMEHLLKTELRYFDMIILDCSPVMAGADPTIVASMVDAIVFVAKWHKTPRKVVHTALRQLRNAQVRPTGLALTQVDVDRLGRYGMGDYGYYYAKYGDYYEQSKHS